MEEGYCCLFCEEELIKNTKGVMKNNKTGEEIEMYICDECDQAFGIKDGELGVAPYDSHMKPIEHECKVCTTVEHFHQKIVFILSNPPMFEPYCFDCGLEYLRNWLRETSPEKVNDITKENVQEISHMHELEVMQKYFNKTNNIKKSVSKNCVNATEGVEEKS